MHSSGGAVLAAGLDGGNTIRGEAEVIESCLYHCKQAKLLILCGFPVLCN